MLCSGLSISEKLPLLKVSHRTERISFGCKTLLLNFVAQCSTTNSYESAVFYLLFSYTSAGDSHRILNVISCLGYPLNTYTNIFVSSQNHRQRKPMGSPINIFNSIKVFKAVEIFDNLSEFMTLLHFLAYLQ